MPQKVLISGVSGPIGAALLPALIAEGYAITRLVRVKSSGPGQIAWNPAQPLAPEQVSGFGAVIHLAGESIVGRWTKAKKRRIADSRVPATRYLAGALAQAGQPPRVLISASAVGYYGSRGDEILREDSPRGTGFASDLCRDWESASQAASSAGVRVVQIRVGMVLSANGGALPQMLPPFRMGVGGNLGNGRQWVSWIDARDVASAVVHVIKTDSLQGPVNMVAPNPVTNADFTKILARVLSRPAIFPMPAFAARLVFGQMADELLLASQRVEPAKLRASGYQFKYPLLEPALREILKP